LVAVHCAGLPRELIESELFGHEKGAFTGAHERRIGRVDRPRADVVSGRKSGKLRTIQIKLLRFLGERTFERWDPTRL